MDNLLREWISADKDVKGDTYALKKMMVQFHIPFLFFNYKLTVLIFYLRMNVHGTVYTFNISLNLIALQEEKDAQLSNIDVVILVPDDKFKTLKPNDTTSYGNCVLVNKDNMAKISEQINEYEAETQSELAKQKYIISTYLYAYILSHINSIRYSMTWNFIMKQILFANSAC